MPLRKIYKLIHNQIINIRIIIFSGTDDDLVATTTITTLRKLESEDVVYVYFKKENDHGESKIVTNLYKTIHLPIASLQKAMNII